MAHLIDVWCVLGLNDFIMQYIKARLHLIMSLYRKGAAIVPLPSHSLYLSPSPHHMLCDVSQLITLAELD